MAQKTSVEELSEMCIQARPQILSLLSIDTPSVLVHTADIKRKMIKKLRTYFTTFTVQGLSGRRVITGIS
jgi:hypothetical protein